MTAAAAAPVSVLCVTHARRDLVVRCLQSCVEQNHPDVEIVVVVNPSGDGTEEAVAERFPNAALIRTHRNIGFFPALNIAIANSTGDYLMTVDDDAYFLQRDALSRLVAAFAAEPELGAATCSIEGPYEPPAAAQSRYIEAFTTGFTMVPRRAFEEWVGFYPDLFFRACGETWMCTALWEHGRRVKRLHDVRMHHDFAAEGRSTTDYHFHALRSQLLCAVMRDPWYLLGPSLAAKSARALAAFLVAGRGGLWARACASALVHAPQSWRSRAPIRWATRRLLLRLRHDVVSDLSAIPEYGAVLDGKRA